MQKTAYELRISDWSSDVCSSDLRCRSLVSLPLLGGGLGRGASTFYRPADHCRHAFQILHHLGIGKPKHMIASRFKPSRTPQIVIHLCRVRITIYFYGKPFASRSKVNDEIPDQDLAGEFDAVQPSSPEN